jgi:hypothetical protein
MYVLSSDTRDPAVPNDDPTPFRRKLNSMSVTHSGGYPICATLQPLREGVAFDSIVAVSDGHRVRISPTVEDTKDATRGDQVPGELLLFGVKMCAGRGYYWGDSRVVVHRAREYVVRELRLDAGDKGGVAIVLEVPDWKRAGTTTSERIVVQRVGRGRERLGRQAWEGPAFSQSVWIIKRS